MRRSALIAVASLLALFALAGCSREKIDWKSAEAADTVEGYDHFVERHPDSALVTQARTRVAQLNEDRDWKKTTGADTADAYRQFLAQHENGKWAEEARIRIENFSLGASATGPAKPDGAAEPVAAAPATAPAHGPKEAQVPPPTVPAAASAKPASPPTAAAAKPTVAAADSKSTAKPVTTTAKPAPEPAKHIAAATAPAPTAKPASPAVTPASAAQFGIQLGAFHSQDAALKNWKQLQVKHDADLHGLFAHAVPVKQSSGQLFRLQAPVGDESRARAICTSLAKQSQPCVVVLPQR